VTGNLYLGAACLWAGDHRGAEDLFLKVLRLEQIVELTRLIAWENASWRFNRALRVPSAELWKPA
jgi:hypothetical protein